MAHLVYMRQDIQRRRLAGGGGGGGGGNVGQVGSYAALDLSVHPIYSVDMGLNDYAIFRTQGSDVGTGTSTHNASGGWNGGAYSRMTPPTTDGYDRGVALNNLYKDATLAIQELNFRAEVRMGPQMGTLWQGCKYSFIHARRTLTAGSAEDRPVLMVRYADSSNNPSWNRANTLCMAPSQGTVQGWGDSAYAEQHSAVIGQAGLTYNPEWLQAFYWVSDGDTGTHQGKPMFSPSEWMTIEQRVITKSTAQYPRGLIAYRVTRRNGQTYERGIPYNWDSNVPLGGYISEIQQFGCGQFNTAPTPHSNLYFDVGDYLTVARDLNGWLGPRTGFIQS